VALPKTFVCKDSYRIDEHRKKKVKRRSIPRGHGSSPARIAKPDIAIFRRAEAFALPQPVKSARLWLPSREFFPWRPGKLFTIPVHLRLNLIDDGLESRVRSLTVRDDGFLRLLQLVPVQRAEGSGGRDFETGNRLRKN